MSYLLTYLNAANLVLQGFLGAGAFLEPSGKLKPPARKRVGFSGMKAPAREGAEIFVGDEKVKPLRKRVWLLVCSILSVVLARLCALME